MPAEILDRPNPQPLPSNIPEEILALSVKLDKLQISDADLAGLEEFRRASNYIAAGMLKTSD
jgi:xylulose-5-phosphate/fructose-6-phosphate phosphoketolase